jgi:Tfp pilus assembly major pilin PilA
MTRIARYFLLGVLVGIVLFFSMFFLIYPQYSDYRARSEVVAWLALIQNVKDDIEGKAISNASFLGVNNWIDKDKFQMPGIDLFEITETGVIILRGGRDGQVIVLIPFFSGKSVNWRCIGGSAQAVPIMCQKFQKSPK